MGGETHLKITHSSIMAKKKTKGKRKIVVQKRPRKKRKTKGKRRKVKGAGVFGNQFPTNRVIDSNQYWQLRAEIAGAEGRVLANLKDRQADYDRKEGNIEKIKQEVRDFTSLTPAQAAYARNLRTPVVNAGPPTIAVPPRASSTPAQAHSPAHADDPASQQMVLRNAAQFSHRVAGQRQRNQLQDSFEHLHQISQAAKLKREIGEAHDSPAKQRRPSPTRSAADAQLARLAGGSPPRTPTSPQRSHSAVARTAKKRQALIGAASPLAVGTPARKTSSVSASERDAARRGADEKLALLREANRQKQRQQEAARLDPG